MRDTDNFKAQVELKAHERTSLQSPRRSREKDEEKAATFLGNSCSQQDTEKDIDSIRFCPFVICHYCIQQAGVWMKMSNQDRKKEVKGNCPMTQVGWYRIHSVALSSLAFKKSRNRGTEPVIEVGKCFLLID